MVTGFAGVVALLGLDIRGQPAEGIVNTGLAYWLFCLLIDAAGAEKAGVITYLMPVVALVLGVAVLGEQLTAGVIAGLALIAAGAWLATARPPGERPGRRGRADRATGSPAPARRPGRPGRVRPRSRSR